MIVLPNQYFTTIMPISIQNVQFLKINLLKMFTIMLNFLTSRVLMNVKMDMLYFYLGNDMGKQNYTVKNL